MDASNIIDSAVSSFASQQINKPADKNDAAKLKFAKDFEGIFINKLLDEMKNSIGEWGDEKDGAAPPGCQHLKGPIAQPLQEVHHRATPMPKSSTTGRAG